MVEAGEEEVCFITVITIIDSLHFLEPHFVEATLSTLHIFLLDQATCASDSYCPPLHVSHLPLVISLPIPTRLDAEFVPPMSSRYENQNLPYFCQSAHMKIVV